MRRRLLPIVILGCAIAGFMLLKATRPLAPELEIRERVWRIEALPASAVSTQPTLVLYGRIEAPDQLRAAAPVSGRVLQVNVRDGDRVAAGAVLAQLDPRDLQPRVAQARADVEREQIRHSGDRKAIAQEKILLDLAVTKQSRFEKLKNARLGAVSAYDQASEDVARIRLSLTQREQSIAEHPARLAQLQARLEEAERDAARGEIVAPFAARIGKVEVAAGDQVQAGQTLLRLYASDELFLRARVPAIYAEELRTALQRGEELKASADFGAVTIHAVLERISGEADARGVDVLLRIENDTHLPVGAFVNAVLERPAANEVFVVPFSALHGGERIYAVRDGRLVGTRVTRIGERREGDEVRLLVRSPEIAPGELLMTTHLPNAIDGLAVEVLAQ
jgi:multidrug efflux pump subunit AcrA (membrane-fusion protein)